MNARFVLLLAALLPAGSAAASELRPDPGAARACLRHGPGFVEVPGTATCIRVGGRVTAGYTATTRRIAREDIAGFGAAARVSADVRTDTAYGPVRSFVRLRVGDGLPGR